MHRPVMPVLVQPHLRKPKQPVKLEPLSSTTSMTARVAEPTGEPTNRGRNLNKKIPLFTNPVSPQYAIDNFRDYFRDGEEREILNYPEIYYIRNHHPRNKNVSNSKGDYFHFVKNDHIAYRYQQIAVLGKGSFGSVIHVYDHKTRANLAIKFLKDKPEEHEEIEFELKIMKKLQTHHEYNIIYLYNSFVYRGFYCFVMEMLDKDTYTYLQSRRFVGLGSTVVKRITKDTAIALAFMFKKGIIHCDLKPENIVFRDIEQGHVKLIDFGCSCYIGKILFTYIQSRFYRAPEVTLGIEYGPEIDVWSLGCVIVELLTGKPLFDVDNETELICKMVDTIGKPPLDFLESAPRARKYFDANGNICVPRYRPRRTSIQMFLRTSDEALVDLVTRCLRWRPRDRLTAAQVVEHPWLEIDESAPKLPNSSRV